jgi:acetyl-CoA C-acetyltransferase
MEAYIYDAVRTPRGRGKADGSLHDVQPVDLLSAVLREIRDRNNLDTSFVDDVIMGCVTPIGEQGADIARTAVLQYGSRLRDVGASGYDCGRRGGVYVESADGF